MNQIKITKTVTSRASDRTEDYLYSIGKIDKLEPEEEVLLAQKIKAGDQSALEKLVKANLKFAVSVAKQFQQTPLPLDDLINEASEGLIKAATKFDETRGFKFISFAVWWIRQTIMQSLADNGRLVRLPVNKVTDTKKVKDQISLFLQEHERVPTDEELLQVAGISKESLLSVQENDARPISFDSPLSAEEGGNFYDLIAGEKTPAALDQIHDESIHYELRRALSCLLFQERLVICMRYGIGRDCELCFDDIAIRLGISAPTVRKIHDMALEKMRVQYGATLRDLFY